MTNTNNLNLQGSLQQASQNDPEWTKKVKEAFKKAAEISQQTTTSGGLLPSTTGYVPSPYYPQDVCPSCGYCPHCGRGGYYGRPYWHRPYSPWYDPYVTYGSNGSDWSANAQLTSSSSDPTF